MTSAACAIDTRRTRCAGSTPFTGANRRWRYVAAISRVLNGAIVGEICVAWHDEVPRKDRTSDVGVADGRDERARGIQVADEPIGAYENYITLPAHVDATCSRAFGAAKHSPTGEDQVVFDEQVHLRASSKSEFQIASRRDIVLDK